LEEAIRSATIPTVSETRDELEAAIAARREVGAELEPQVIDGFVERIEKRIDERARELAPKKSRTGLDTRLALGSMAFAIPLLGIAGGIAGLPGIALVCLAIVIVNVIAARG
jgi:hypothetical protein